MATVHFSQLWSTGTYNTSIFSGTGVQATVPMRTTASSWFLSRSSFSLQVGVSYVATVLYCAYSVSPATGGLSSIPPLLLQPYEYYVLYCCTALLSLPLLLRSILLQVLLLFPLCCCIVGFSSAAALLLLLLYLHLSLNNLPPARKCQQHEMHPPRNRRMINMYRRV